MKIDQEVGFVHLAKLSVRANQIVIARLARMVAATLKKRISNHKIKKIEHYEVRVFIASSDHNIEQKLSEINQRIQRNLKKKRK